MDKKDKHRVPGLPMIYVNLSLSNFDQLNLLIFGNFSDLFKSRLCPRIMLLNMALTQGRN